MELGLLLFVLAATIGGAGLFWYYSETEKTKRALRNATKYSIGEFPDGSLGKVVGGVRFLGEPLIAPLSGRRCAYYSIRVEQYRSSGNSGSWHNVIRDEQGIDFVVDDGTGHAIVQVAAAKTVLSDDHETKSGTLDDPTQVEREYLESHAIEGTGWVFNKTLRYIEGVLEAEERVSVFGYGSKEPDPEAVPTGYRELPKMRLRISGSVSHPPMISDLPSVH